MKLVILGILATLSLGASDRLTAHSATRAIILQAMECGAVLERGRAGNEPSDEELEACDAYFQIYIDAKSPKGLA